MENLNKPMVIFFSLLLLILPSISLQAQCSDGETFFSYCYDNSAVNVVAFEICPSAGMAAEANIIGGTIDDFGAPNDNLTVYQGTTGSGTSGTLLFGPMAGNLNGTTIMGNVADQCLIFVFNSDLFGNCQDGSEETLEVCGSDVAPSAVFTAPADLCINSGVQTGLSGGTPTGGVYSGTGVIDDGNGMTYSFDPAAATVGVHSITYAVGGSMATDDIEVFALGSVSFTALADLCIDADIQAGLSGGTPTGGTYSGPGVTDDGNGMTYTFNPALAGLGVHSISYTESAGCNETAMDNVEVLAACSCPVGDITFFNCYGNGENDLVIFEVCPTAGMAAQAQITGGTYDALDNLTVYQGATGSGTGGSIVFGPANGNLAGMTISGNLADQCLIFVSNSGISGSCQDGTEDPLVACGRSIATSVSFTALDDLCINAGVQTGLGGATPTGGVYSGAGVTDDGNGTTYSFDPAAATAGVHTLTYTVGGNSGMDEVEVFALDAVTFTAPVDLCIDAGIQNGLGGGSPAGGVYSGAGVTDNGNGTTFNFNPALAGLGMITITYTLPGGCAPATDQVDVLAACGCPSGETTFFACYGNNETDVILFEICPSAGMAPQATISQGSYDSFDDDLTVYEGATGSGTGGTVVFGPSAGNLAGNVITTSALDLCLTFVSNSGGIGSCQDGTETPLVVCAIDILLVNFTTLADLCVNAGVQNGLSGISVTGGVFSGSGVTDDGNGSTYSFDPAVAGVGIHTITYTISGTVVTDEVEVLGNVMFTALADLSVNAGVQTGLSGGTPMGGVYGGPGVTDGGDGMTYSFNPAVAGVGIHTLTYTADADGCTGIIASDDVEVLNITPPSFSKSFFPNQIAVGSVTVLSFTIANNSAGPLSDVAFTDNLPAGMVVATPANITSTCFAGTITAVDGGSTITLTDGEVTGSGTCVITVNVVGITAGTLTNTTGDLTSSAGNSGTASANLTVASDRPTVTKSFAPSTINANGRSTMTFTIDNTAGTINYLGISITDNLPSGMVIASPSNASSSCSNMTLTAVPGASTFTVGATILGLTTIPAGTVCTITVDVIGTTVGTLNNITNNITVNNNFFQLVNLGLASASLEVLPPGDITFGKSFIADPVAPGGTVDLEFTITNQNRDFAATNIAFTDDLTTVLAGLVATGLPLNDVCGTGSQISGTTSLSLTGGTLAPESTCTFTVTLQVPAGATSGIYNNTTNPITGTIDGTMVTGNTASDDLFIQQLPTFTKSFLSDPVLAGGTTTLEFTIENTSTTAALTDLTFTDGMDFLSGAIVSTVPAANSCGSGSFFFMTTVLGVPTFTMTGGNIPASGSCTFSIDITVPAGTAPQTVTNTTSNLSGLLGGTSISAAPATDDLTILAIPKLTKSFTNDPVLPGDIVDLEFTISYSEGATGDATNISFTDDLNAVIAGMAGVGLPLNNVCGTGSSISGTTNLTFSGGTLSPGSTCTFTVQVQVPAGAAVGTFTNTTSDVTSTVGGMTATGPPATDNLLINIMQFTKEFIGGPVIPGELTTLRFTMQNLSSTLDATSIIFTDNLNTMLSGTAAEAPLPATPCGAGSAISGTTFLVFTGGTVAAGTTCSFDVPVRILASASPGNYTNITSNLIATIDGTSRTLPTATANLVVENNYIQLSKSFTNDPVLPGNTVDVEYTLTNLDPTNTLSDIDFTVDFDALLTGLAATGLPQSNICGAGSNLSGTGLMSFTGGTLTGGASCTFTVTLQTPATAIPGTTFNCPTSTLTGEIDGFAVIGDAADDDLSFLALEFSKSFAGPVTPGETTTLTFTITNTDPSNSITDIAFTDDLDAFITGMTATNLPLSGTCGPLSGVTGTSVINFGRGELGPSETCSFDVTVLVPCTTAAGTYTNTTGTLTALGILDAGTASADLMVSSPLTVSITSQTNIDCNGASTGSATASATGGSAAYTYAWSNGSNTASISSVAAGTYTVSVTDANNCGPAITMVTITEPTAVGVSITAQTNVDCNGASTGSATASATGGTGAHTYLWSNGSGTASISGVSAGTYTVSVTDANNCGPAITMVTITEPTVVGVSITSQMNVDCNGATTGSATASATGGTGAHSYMWSNGSTMSSISSVAAGTYTVSVTDANNCGPAITMVTITEPTAVGVSITSQMNVDCNGASTGSATASATGGTGAHSYMWSNGSTMSSISSVAAGTYTVSVTDANNCGPAITMVTITEPTAVGVSITSQMNVDCNGASTGSATASATGGTGAHSYMWSNGSTMSSISSVAAGTYTVSVTDANNCGPAITMVTITEPTVVGVSITAQTNVDCNGASTGSATASATGGTGAHTYLWSNGSGTASISGVSAGTYTVSVTDANNCGPAITMVTITEPSVVSVSITAQMNVECNGASTGSATASATGGTGAHSYMWSNGATMATISGLAAGTYTVSVTDANNCGPAITTVMITASAEIDASIIAQTNVDCNGASTGSATASATGGTGAYTYLWSNGTNMASISSVTAGTYTVSITDANNCGPAITMVTITEPTAVGVNITAQTNVDCNGASTGSATASATGGTGAHSYMWSNGTSMASISGVVAGTYTVSVTDANNCGPAITMVTITEPTAIGVSITAQTNADCNGASTGSATASATGGTGAHSYMWSNGTSMASISGVAAGTYTVSVTDANNCGPAITMVTITEPTAVGVSITTQMNVDCNGASTGSATASGSGGTGAYTYLWSNGTGTATISSVAAGTYTVSVTDANNCGPATTTVTITEPTALGVSITAQTNVDCNGASTGSATAAGSGGTPAYSYLWSNGANTATTSGLIAGSYTVSVTDVNGCGPVTTSVTITEQTAVSVSIIGQTNVDCNGANTGSATASASGGTSAYTYLWSNGGNMASISGVAAGTYTVSVTDANNCGPATTTVTITEPTAVGVSITAQTNVDCNGASTGSATASATGGTGAYTYLWSNGSGTASISSVSAGTYTVSVTDANNCGPATTTVTITEPEVVGVSITAQTNVLCNGESTGSATASGTGGTGAYGYIWSNGGNMATISSLAAGTYTVTVTDANNCGPAITMVTITEPVPVVANFTAPAPDVCIEDPVVTGLGGGSPEGGVYTGIGVMDDGNGMTFSFDPMASAPTGGNVTVTYTYTDMDGCSDTAMDDIFVNPICCLPPTIVCAADNFGLPMGCNVTPPAGTTNFNTVGGPTPNPALPTVAEGCEPLTLTFMDATADVGCTRTLTRTYRITDDNGDFAECDQTFSWTVDTTPPTFDNTPADGTVECSAIPPAETVTASDNCVSVEPILMINEVHYDNTGGDVGEFVEIAGTAGIDLSLYEVYAYEGSDGAFDAQVSLSGILPNETMGFGALAFTRTELPTGFFENGSADGIALVEIATGTVIDFISYEGTITATNGPATGMTSINIGTEPGGTPIGESLQLSGTGCNIGSFAWGGPVAESPGLINTGQTFDLTACTSSSSAMVTLVENFVPAASCPQEGTLTRTWTATDGCGNSAMQTQTLTIVDTTAPIICDAPANETISCDQPVPVAPVVTAFDNCDVMGIGATVWVNEFHYDNTGGDVGEFIEIAGVAGTDLTGYTLALYNGANGQLDQTIDLSGVIPAETCGFGTLSFTATGLMNGSPDGFAFVQGTTVLEFLSYEGSFTAANGPAVGMTSTDVGVSEPGTTPVGQSLQLTGSGSSGTAFTWTGPAAASPGALNTGQTLVGNLIATLSEVTTPGACANEMTITRTWNVMDACGNPAIAAVQTITIIDTEGPVITCPPSSFGLLCNTDLPVVTNISDFIALGGTATDNCGTNFTVSYVDNPVSPALLNYCPTAPASERTITRTYTVLDECDNPSTCTQTFVFEESVIGPVITEIPLDQTVDCAFNVMPQLNLFQADTDCALGLTKTVSEVSVMGTPNCPGAQYQYTYTAIDECGRIATHTQIYTIENEGPVFVCPVDICVIECPADTDMIQATFDAFAGLATVLTSCSGLEPTIGNDFNPNGFTSNDCNSGPVAYPNATQYQITTFFATDLCGRTSTCTALVVITDNSGPVIEGEVTSTFRECDDLTQMQYEEWIDANLSNLSATDACGDVSWDYSPASPNQGPCVNGFSVTNVQFTALDGCGNASHKTATFTLKNNFPPTWIGELVDLTVECSDPIPDFDTPVFGNACGQTELTFEDATIPGSCAGEYSLVRVWTVTDNCGESNTTKQTIFVTDTQGPEFTFVPSNEMIDCSQFPPVFGEPQVTDGCGNVSLSFVTEYVTGDPNSCLNGEDFNYRGTWTATDACGNITTAEQSFVVDALGTELVTVTGHIITEENEPIEAVDVAASGSAMYDSQLTDETGYFGFSLPSGANYEINPSLTSNPLNGVNTLDLILMSKHILGIQPFDSPYKMIAADINRSGSLSGFDLVELRKLILFITTDFTNNTSWRFVDEAYTFPNPTNPFATTFPEVYNINDLLTSEVANFIGIKIGDVNGNAVANQLQSSDTRTEGGTLNFEIMDRELKAGEEIQIDFKTNDFKSIQGYQFTLNFDPQWLAFVDVEAGALSSFSSDNFGFSKLNEGAITSSWNSLEAISLEEDAIAFSLIFKAKANTPLSQVLSLGSTYTKAEAYTENAEALEVKLLIQPENGATAIQEFALYQNRPNPFKAESVIGFVLPEASTATLSIYDVAGRQLHLIKGDFSAGYQEVNINRSDLGNAGVLYYQLDTPSHSATRKMILID